MASSIAACHHVAICVHDVDASRKFYGELLGLPEIERPEEIEKLIRGAWYQLGTSELHMFENQDFEPLASPIGPHFALHTSDFDAVVKRLENAGCEFSFTPGTGPDGVARAFLRDPTGNLVELTDAALHG